MDPAGAAKLEQELKVARKALERSRAQELDLQQQVKKLQQQAQSSQQQIKELRQQAQSSQQQVKEQQQQAQSSQQQVKELQQQAQQVKALRQQAQSSQQQAASSQQQVKELQQQVQTSQQQAKELQQQLARAQAEVGARERELEELRTKAARQQTKSGIQPPDAMVVKLEQDLVQARARLEQSATDEEALRARTAELESQLAALAEKDAAAARELQGQQDLRRLVEEQRARLAAADNKLARMDALEQERLVLKEEVAGKSKELVELQGQQSVVQERDDLALEVQTLRERTAALDKLREEKAELADRLREAKDESRYLAEQVRNLDEARDERTDLAIQVEVLSERIKEVERLREELAAATEQAAEAENLRMQLEALSAETADLRSQGVISQASPRPALQSKQGAGFGGSLQAIVDEISGRETMRSAAVADEAGFVVVGTGSETEAMAALAASFADFGNRVQTILPLSAPRTLSVADGNALTFSAQPFNTSTGPLILTTLSVGPGPDAKTVDDLIRKISRFEAQ